MHTRMLLWQPFDSTSVVSLAFLNLLEPFACSGIMIGTFDSSVSPLKLFTMLPLAHTIHSPSSGTPCILQVCRLVTLTIFIVSVRLLEFRWTSTHDLVALANSTGPCRWFPIQPNRFVDIYNFHW